MDIAEQLQALTDRIRAVEDHLAISQLLTRYSPAADSGDGASAASLWTADGSYDAQVGRWSGTEAIAGLFDEPLHQGIMAQGCGHILTPPHVRVDGDSAAATNYGLLCINDGESFRVWRVTACHWDLVRTADGWKIHHRVNRVLNGEEAARALLHKAWD